MLQDANRFDDGQSVDCDILVVGAGMAGLCFAKQFDGLNLRILITESGDETESSFHNGLNEGQAQIQSANDEIHQLDEYLTTSRSRSFGGTGNIWGGKCGELEAHDFNKRPWVNYSGWPIQYRDLKPFYNRACQHLNIPVFSNESSHPNGSLDKDPKADFTTVLRRYSGLTGKDPGNKYFAYKYNLANQESITVLKNASVVRLISEQNDSVSYAEARNNDGALFNIRASVVVLAAGGLENPRILLNSVSSQTPESQNVQKNLGRFYSGHIVVNQISPENQKQVYLKPSKTGVSTLALYSNKNPTQAHGIFSLKFSSQWRNRMRGFSVSMKHQDSITEDTLIPLFFMSELEVNPESTVSLNGEKDALGQPRLSLNWKVNKSDQDNLEKGYQLFSQFIEKMGYGNLIEKHSDAPAFVCSRHHIGTTRMSENSERGVVDENCKVHGVNNLYVAGTSVFSTPGLANPTLTVIALAIRLADHIKVNRNSILR